MVDQSFKVKKNVKNNTIIGYVIGSVRENERGQKHLTYEIHPWNIGPIKFSKSFVFYNRFSFLYPRKQPTLVVTKFFFLTHFLLTADFLI